MSDPLSKLPLSILALEDEALILLNIEGIFVEAGYEVATASTAEDALAFLDFRAFDAAVIDLGMGKGNSFPVAEALSLRKIPFIFCTASDVEVRAPYLDIPLVGKPFTDQQLLDAISQILQPR
jgi:CheY-like chemotaxis protein